MPHACASKDFFFKNRLPHFDSAIPRPPEGVVLNSRVVTECFKVQLDCRCRLKTETRAEFPNYT